MAKMCFWNDGDPRIVNGGKKAILDKVSGRFISDTPDPEIDLYRFVEVRPPLGEYEVHQGYVDDNDGWTVTRTFNAVAMDAGVALARAKSNAVKAIKMKRDGIQFGGVEWSPDGGVTTYIVQTDKDSQAKLSGAVVRTDKKNSAQQAWRMKDNSVVVLNKVKFDDMAVAVGDHVDACYVRQAELEALVEAASTAAEVDAIDIQSGWPAVPGV